MTKSKPASAAGKSAAAGAYEADRLYKITLARAVEGPAGVWFSPAHEVKVKGKLIAGLGDAVTHAEPL